MLPCFKENKRIYFKNNDNDDNDANNNIKNIYNKKMKKTSRSHSHEGYKRQDHNFLRITRTSPPPEGK